MMLAQMNGDTRTPQSVIDELLARGISQSDIDLGIMTQDAQRRTGAPVYPLAVLVGAEPVTRDYRAQVGHATRQLMRSKPPARKSAGGLHISGTPVWAGSVQTGEAEESEFVRPLSTLQRTRFRKACHMILDKAREVARNSRAGEAQNAEQSKLMRFTTSCHQIYLRLLDELFYRKGWCFPSYETVMRWTGLSRGTVHNAIKALRAIGLLDWKRRYVYSQSKEHGARSEQTSNLYRAEMPKWLAKLIGLDAPLPDDAVCHREAALEDHALMLANAGKVDRRRLMPSDPESRAALIAAATRADQRLAVEAGSREFNDWIDPHIISIFDMRRKRSCPGRATRQP